MKTYTFSIILVFTSLLSFAQNEVSENYLSREENETWLMNLEKSQDLETKLNAIQKKIVDDAQFIAPRPRVSYTGLSKEARERLNAVQDSLPKVTAACKILFVLNSDDMYLLDLEKNSKYKDLIKMLNSEHIDSVKVLKDTKATAFYGAQASCGAVLMKTKNDELATVLKKLNTKTTKK
ncbi:hypothetical protein [Leeuwenhoekiella sp. W20_SRS_FM14]|uniref:hypothetical protein n=1 Tax=Leeuwenhoekiella sp. W20_SRS_FM14 TaxID=3240270 RepID=UPI003F9A1028